MSSDCPVCADLIPGAGRLCLDHAEDAQVDAGEAAADAARDEAA